MKIKISFVLVKKVPVIILLAAYTFASSGASVDLHYCMGKLIGWDFDYSAKSGCSNCGMPTKAEKGCCHDKQIQIKVDKEQQLTYNTISLLNHQITLAPGYPALNDLLHNSTIVTHPSIHGPPVKRYTPVYLFDCNFRI
jgi:hypothetical protein